VPLGLALGVEVARAIMHFTNRERESLLRGVRGDRVVTRRSALVNSRSAPWAGSECRSCAGPGAASRVAGSAVLVTAPAPTGGNLVNSRKWLKPRPENDSSQGQNLAVTGSCVPSSLDCGRAGRSVSRSWKCCVGDRTCSVHI